MLLLWSDIAKTQIYKGHLWEAPWVGLQFKETVQTAEPARVSFKRYTPSYSRPCLTDQPNGSAPGVLRMHFEANMIQRAVT